MDRGAFAAVQASGSGEVQSPGAFAALRAVASKGLPSGLLIGRQSEERNPSGHGATGADHWNPAEVVDNASVVDVNAIAARQRAELTAERTRAHAHSSDLP